MYPWKQLHESATMRLVDETDQLSEIPDGVTFFSKIAYNPI